MHRLGFVFSAVLILALAFVALDARPAGKVIRDGALPGSTLIQDPSVGKIIKGPLITEDANAVCHAYFDGVSIQDTKGCTWTMVGTVPQVAGSTTVPASAGPFADANYYTQGTGSALSLVGDFTAAYVFIAPASVVTFPNLFSNTDAATVGYNSLLGSGKFANTVNGGGAFTAPAPLVTGVVNVGCMGRTGGNTRIYLNAGGPFSTAQTYTAAPGSAAFLGRWNSAGRPFNSRIVEAYWTSTPVSDALCAAIIAEVKSKLSITAW